MLKKHTSNKYLLETALIAAAACILSLLPAVIAGRGILALADDFSWQQQIFNTYAVSLYRSPADFGWSWVVDLGADVSNALAFYNLYSPFTLILALFPAAVTPYLAAPMLVLKYVVAAVAAAAFVKRFVRDGKTAVLGGVLYAFSGIQTVSLLFPFHDALCLFPVLMLAVECLLEKKPAVFALTAALCAITNYYLFFGEVVFLVIWFIFRVALSENIVKKDKIRHFLVMLGEGTVGILISAIVLLPAFLSVMNNPRVSSLSTGVLFGWQQYVTLLQAYFLPADIMGTGNYLFQQACDSCALYLPLVAMTGVFAYFKGNFRKSKAWLPVVLTGFSLVPVLNAAFSMFNARYYARWFYMPALVFAMLTCVAIDGLPENPQRVEKETPAENPQLENPPEKRKNLIFGAKVNLAFVVFTVAVSGAAIAYYKIRGIDNIAGKTNPVLWAVYGGAGIAAAVFVLIIAKKANSKKAVALLTAGAVAVGVLSTAAAAVRYTFVQGKGEFYEPGIVNGEGNIGAEKTKAVLTESGNISRYFPEDGNFRIRTDWHEAGESYFANSFDNISMLTGIPSVNSFISTAEGGLFEFYENLGTERLVRTVGSFQEELMALLSCRYYLSESTVDGSEPVGKYEYSDGTIIYIYEYENFLPIGFTYDSYVTSDELKEAEPAERAAIMLENIVIEQKDAEKLAENGITLAHGDVHAATKTLEEAVADRKAEASGRFARNEKGFVSEIEAGEKTVAFFSVPYSKGWSATVNGQKTDVLDAGGMMAVALEKGTNTVVFTYKTPGFTAGAVLFSVGMLAAAAEIIVYAVRGKSRKSKGNAEKRRKM